jgi:hypothetical protein
MQITAARGAIAITLDRPRVLFFPMEQTFELVRRYGVDFLSELYTVQGKGKDAKLALKSPDALRTFLWIGLQAELVGTGEALSEDEAGEFIHPWTIGTIFNALVLALTGAMSTPKPPDGPGKEGAPGELASPAAAVEPSQPASTSTKARGSSAAR